METEGSYASVTVDRIISHFSASHALISYDCEEGLHGHNYYVELDIKGKIDENDIVIDFILLEKLLSEITSFWDHYILIPSKNNFLEINENDKNLEIKYGNRYYSIPKNEIRLLNCVNVTAESLARLIGEKIRYTLKKKSLWRGISALRVTIWETPFYRATYLIESNFSEN